jgi:hypothetical protein
LENFGITLFTVTAFSDISLRLMRLPLALRLRLHSHGACSLMLAQPIHALFLSLGLHACACMTSMALIEPAYVLSLSTNIIETSSLSKAFDIAGLAWRVLDDTVQTALRLSDDPNCLSHS